MSVQSEIENAAATVAADIRAAEEATLARARAAGAQAEGAVVTLFPVSLLWAHKGLLGLFGAATVLGGVIGHAVR